MKRYDVAVIGGGFSGVAAALAAARGGAKTIIVEKGNALGGAAVNCLVNPFMPYWTQIDGKTVNLSAGIFKEIRDELQARGAMRKEEFLEEELKFILNEKVLKEGIDLLFHSRVFSVEVENGRISSVTVATVGGTLRIEADYFIDATGDAEVAYLSGCPTVLGRDGDHLCQPMTLCFRVGNVDTERFYESKNELQEKYKKRLSDGRFINPRENILVFRTPIPNVLHFNTTRVIKKDPTDPIAVSEAEIIARRQVFEIFEFIKENADGMENSYLMMTAAQIGVRESRMIVGEHILTEAECRAFTKFEDGIAACNYDIDIHNPEGSGTSHYYFPAGEYYTIPYRSLIPKGIDNMLVAGRCISSDHGAQASYRIMPVVCCIGEAAGSAIAMAVETGTDTMAVDIQRLRELLKKNGAFV